MSYHGPIRAGLVSGGDTYLWITSSVSYKFSFSGESLTEGAHFRNFKVLLKIWQMFKKIVHD